MLSKVSKMDAFRSFTVALIRDCSIFWDSKLHYFTSRIRVLGRVKVFFMILGYHSDMSNKAVFRPLNAATLSKPRICTSATWKQAIAFASNHPNLGKRLFWAFLSCHTKSIGRIEFKENREQTVRLELTTSDLEGRHSTIELCLRWWAIFAFTTGVLLRPPDWLADLYHWCFRHRIIASDNL